MEPLLDSGVEYSPLPSIYQLETTSVCDLKCPMCPRTTVVSRESRFMDLDLIRQMHGRGEFAGTTFTELQQSGEPTLHPQLEQIIDYLQGEVGLLVGMSTHGLRLNRQEVRDTVMKLQTLTISVDSVDPEIYHKMRYPAQFGHLINSLRAFFEDWAARYPPKPFVELQLINTPLVSGSGNVKALQEVMDREGWNYLWRIRTQKDAWLELDGRAIQGTMPRPGNGQICMNPFTSVSVNQRGDVVSCCMIFEPNKNELNYLGNLYEQTLEEIWNGPRVAALRAEHRSGNLSGHCAKCYTWSPVDIHRNIISGLVQVRV